LSQTQASIEKASSYFFKLAKRDPSQIDTLIKYWTERTAQASVERKIAFIYLANDLIQKSKIHDMKGAPKQTGGAGTTQTDLTLDIPKKKTFWKEFQSTVEEVLPQVLVSLQGHENYQKDIVKVLEVWKTR
jgi:hypothetical protein